MKKNIMTTKLTTNVMTLAVLIVAIAVAFVVMVSITNAGDEAVFGEDGVINYYPGDSDDGVVTINTYHGIKSTEYNPELWSGWGEVQDSTANWVGPETTVTWNNGDHNLLTINLQNGSNRNYRIALPEDITGVTVNSLSGCTDFNGSNNVIRQDGDTFYLEVKYNNGSVTLNVTYDESITVNKVFGGWKERTHTVSFDKGDIGATGPGLSPISVTQSDNVYTLPWCVYSLEGKVFAGWSLDLDGDGISETRYPGDTVTVVRDLTVTATWASAGNQVSFDSDGGVGTISSLYVVNDYDFVLPFNTFTKAGYIFNGWLVGGEDKNPGDTIKIIEDTSVKAKWSESNATCKLKVYREDQTLQFSDDAFVKGNGYTLPYYDRSPTEAKTFKMWCVETESGSITAHYPSEMIVVDSNTVITPLWDVIYPGEVVDWKVTELEAKWVTPNLYITNTLTLKPTNNWINENGIYYPSPSDAERVSSMGIHPYRMLDNADNYADRKLSINDANYYCKSSESTVFTAINVFSNYGNNALQITSLGMGTYRTIDPQDNDSVGTKNRSDYYDQHHSYDGLKAEISITTDVEITGDVIIDTVNMKGSSGNGSHGDGTAGLHGNGHRLILGTGIHTAAFEGTDLNSYATNVNEGKNMVQLYGGSGKSAVTTKIDSKRMVFGRSDVSMDGMVNIGTFLIVHSGVYGSIMGAANQNIGSPSTFLSTYTVLKECIVVDTVGGGTSSSANSHVYGAAPDGDPSRTAGGTYTYALGLFTLGDYWQDSTSGYVAYNTDHGGVKGNTREWLYTEQSSIIQAGCSKGKVYGGSHMFISGKSSVWDVQAGGRIKSTLVEYAYLEITGHSEVRRLACGTITDGVSSDANTVNYANIYVGGSAMVASVYGAGFDTWSAPKASSMTEGKILVEIAGGTVYDVFGGGYRGSIGTYGDSSKLSITVQITGGNILGDVFGGGSGGLNKMKHYASGKGYQTGDGTTGNQYSTGKSYVYGNITVMLTGGTVSGSVYGGGMSVPVLSTYGNVDSTISGFNTNETDGHGGKCNVATVEGVTVVMVSGAATVNGSVYGGGKGIKLDSNNEVDKDYYGFNRVIFTDSQGNRTIDKMYWTASGMSGNYSYNNTIDYADYAQVCAGVSSAKSGTIVIVNGNIMPIHGSVYGGGGYSKVSGDILVNIDEGIVEGNVFGGGLGTQGKVSTVAKRTTYINGKSIIGESVYGGSSDGDDGDRNNDECDSTVVISEGVITGSIFGGGFKGNTYGSTYTYLGYYIPSRGNTDPIINEQSQTGTKVIRVNSIYAGGNIDTESHPYDTSLVKGDGKIWVNGRANTYTITGSIMGSGNACLTDGDTSISISNFSNTSQITGIHRAKELLIESSSLKVTGRNPLTPVAGQTKSLAIYQIDNMTVKGGTTLIVDSPVDDVDTIHSLYSTGGYTTVSSPENKLIFSTGTTVYIRHINGSGNNYTLHYGTMNGYMMMNAMEDGNYGAYVIGKTSASGGFSVVNDGNFKEAETSITNDVCCWFISGVEKKVLTMELNYDKDGRSYSSSYVSINKFQSDTSIIYTGGMFTRMSYDPANNPYTFVRPGSQDSPSELGLAIGYKGGNSQHVYDNTERLMDLGSGLTNNKGTFFLPSNMENDLTPGSENYDRSLVSVPFSYSGKDTKGVFNINLMLSGQPLDATAYAGYLLLNFQEVKVIGYETVIVDGQPVETPTMLIANSIELRIDVYIYGSTGTEANNRFSVEVTTNKDNVGLRSGSSSTLIPQQYQMATTKVTDIEIAGNMDLSVLSGSEVIVPNCEYAAPAGKAFQNWILSMDGGNNWTQVAYPGQKIVFSEEPQSPEANTIYVGNTDIKIKPVWDNDASYDVTFTADGGSGYMKPIKVSSGAKYVLPNCGYTAPNGKKFFKWDLGAPGDVVVIDSNKTLTPVWVNDAEGYTITFSPDGGKGYIADVEVAKDQLTSSKYVLPNNSYTKDNFVFIGWKIGDSNETVCPGTAIEITGPTTIKAKWEDKNSTRYKVDYTDGYHWTGIIAVSAVVNPDNTSGWAVVGSEVKWNLGGEMISDNDTLGTLLGSIIANVSFSIEGLKCTEDADYLPAIRISFDRGGYLAYTDLIVRDKEYYTVKFVDHGLQTNIKYEENTLLTRQLCETPSGSNFNGWYLDSEFVNRYGYNLRVTSDDITLYARYTYVVTLDNMNGTSFTLYLPEQAEGALISTNDLPTPAYDGYDFKGWYKDRSLIYNWTFSTDRVYEDTTLYAKWQGKEVRVNFWWYDNNDELCLFGGVDGGGQAIAVKANGSGEFDLSNAYMMNREMGIYPTVKYGSTFDTVDPWHGSVNILKYAENSINFTGMFVRWQVVSPIDDNLRVSIYEDTVVGNKVLKLVTDSQIEQFGSLWNYYVHNNGGYPRVDNGGPDMLEINLLAETTKIALKVNMGLEEQDEKYSSTISIDDPASFLVYPNGPDLKNPVENKEGWYYGVYGHTFYEGDKDQQEKVLFYWNEDGSARYYWDSTDRCWKCILKEDVTPETNAGDHYEFIYKLNKATRNGYTLLGWFNEYISVSNAIHPNPDLERNIHIWTDNDNKVTVAKLMSSESLGIKSGTQLLVGNYVVNASNADANGTITLVGLEEKDNITNFTITVEGGTGSVGQGAEGAEVTLSNPSGEANHHFLGWMVKDRLLTENIYEVKASDADATGTILIKSAWAKIYTITISDVYNATQYDQGTQGIPYEGNIITLMTPVHQGSVFSGWSTFSGAFTSSYEVSAKDAVNGEITLTAVWDYESTSEYALRLVTPIHSDGGSGSVAYFDRSPSRSVDLSAYDLSQTGYNHIGWKVITGSEQRIIKGNTYEYNSDTNDADILGNIVLEAIWDKTYMVKVGNASPVEKKIDDTVVLSYTLSVKFWKVSSDFFVEGKSLSEGTFVMEYKADWEQIDYSLRMNQPGNGVVDAYLSVTTGAQMESHDKYITNWGQAFHYGDKITLVYTPSTPGVQFIKWVITGKYYIDNASSQSTTLIVQGDCSISVEESTGGIIDILLKVDGGLMDEDDKEYTSVYMRSATTGIYYPASALPSVNGMDHYSARLPYDDSYEMCLRYGVASDGQTKLSGFDDYEEYVMVGTKYLERGGSNSFLYVIITARFVPDINTTDPSAVSRVVYNTNDYVMDIFTDSTVNGTKLQVRDSGLRIASDSHVKILDGSNKLLASVSKYVGMEMNTLGRLNALGQSINNSTGISPPVELTVERNLGYSAYEGYPWYINSTDDYKKRFIVNNVNVRQDAQSNSDSQQFIYLDWTMASSPADVIIKLNTIDSGNTVTVTFVKDGDQSDPIEYIFAGSTGKIPLEIYDEYDITVVKTSGVGAATFAIEDGKVPRDKDLVISGLDGNYSVTITYSKKIVTFDLLKSVQGQPDIIYDGDYTREATLGVPVELPTRYKQGSEIWQDIVRWTVVPYSHDYTYVEKENNKLVYTPVLSDFDGRRAIVFTADWGEENNLMGKKYEIVFATEFGTVPTAVYKNAGEEVDLTDLSHAGYKFSGWRVWGSTETTGLLNPPSKYVVNGDHAISGIIILEAVWEEKINEQWVVITPSKQYSIIFASEFAGVPNINTRYASISDVITLPGFNASAPHAFNGWKLWNSNTYATASQIAVTNNIASDPVSITYMIPFTSVVTMTFITSIEQFESGVQRLTYSSQGGRTIGQYIATGLEDEVIRFINAHSSNEAEYKCTGFVSGDITFPNNSATSLTLPSYTFVAQWVINEKGKRTFQYDIDDSNHVDVTVIKDEVGSGVLSRGTEYNLRTGTEINLYIKPATGYTIDVEKTRGEFGYTLVKTFLYDGEGNKYYKEGDTYYKYVNNEWVRQTLPYPMFYYYDTYGNKFVKKDVTTVYLYDADSWQEYTVTSIAGQDGAFIQKFTPKSSGITYKMTRDQTYYKEVDGIWVSVGSLMFFTNKVQPEYNMYGSEYDCVEDGALFYQASPYLGSTSNFVDNYGNIWILGNDNIFSVSEMTVYQYDYVNNKEIKYSVDGTGQFYKYDENGQKSPTPEDVNPTDYYYKDAYGNCFKDNGLVKGKIVNLYVEGEVTEYKVEYVNLNNVIKVLYTGDYDMEHVVYGITKEGELLHKSGGQWTPSNKKVYLDSGKTNEYHNDYHMIRVNPQYNYAHEYRENDESYLMDSFGNVYKDWLGIPTELSDGKGYSWTFLLQDNMNPLIIYVKKVSYNVNFFVNGELIELTSPYTISTIDTELKEYNGQEIPKYGIVAFNEFLKEGDVMVKWYTDASYTEEYKFYKEGAYDNRYLKSDVSPNFLKRTYQFYSTDNISLYASYGKLTVYVHDYYDNDSPVIYSLSADQSGHVILPTIHEDMENHFFVGWAIEDQYGVRKLIYKPGETISVQISLNSTLDLYPYYLAAGSPTKYYDGMAAEAKLYNDLNEQEDPFDANIITVRYSETEIHSINDGSSDFPQITHAGSKQIWFCSQFNTYRGAGDAYHDADNIFTVDGSITINILKVDAYAVAPTAHIREVSDGTKVTVSISDIETIGLVEGDYALYWAEIDGDSNRVKTDTSTITLSGPGTKNIYVWVEFTDMEKEFASKDYNLIYIDGVLIIYPKDSSKDDGLNYT